MKGGWAGAGKKRFHVKHRISLDALVDFVFAVVALVFYEDSSLEEQMEENAVRQVVSVLRSYSGGPEEWHADFAAALLSDVVAAVHHRLPDLSPEDEASSGTYSPSTAAASTSQLPPSTSTRVAPRVAGSSSLVQSSRPLSTEESSPSSVSVGTSKSKRAASSVTPPVHPSGRPRP